MPAIGNVVIADGQATPVNHTFVPITGQSGSDNATWRDQALSSRAQNLSITGSLRQANGNSKRDKVSINLYKPLVRTDVSGVVSVVETMSVRIEITVPSIATDAERKDLRTLAKNLMAHQILIDYVDSGLPAY